MTAVDPVVQAPTAWWRAAPLAERCPSPAAGTAASDSRAERRLARWRGQEPFFDSALWQARLRAAGLSEAGLRAMLNEPAGALSDRLAEPHWAGWLLDCLDAQEPAAVGGSPDTDGAFLAPIMEPLLRAAQDRLHADLHRLAGGPHRAGFDVVDLRDQFAGSLRQLVHRMLSRTVTLELNWPECAASWSGTPPRNGSAPSSTAGASRIAGGRC